ncbi:2067_t:CDS:2, partial [Racocetra fulgida]
KFGKGNSVEVNNEKSKISDSVKGKLVKINEELAKASIRTSLCMNLISINYAKVKELTWKHINKKIDNKVVGYVSEFEVDVDGVVLDKEMKNVVVRFDPVM